MEPWPSDVQLFQPYEVREVNMKDLLKRDTHVCDFCDNKSDEEHTRRSH